MYHKVVVKMHTVILCNKYFELTVPLYTYEQKSNDPNTSVELTFSQVTDIVLFLGTTVVSLLWASIGHIVYGGGGANTVLTCMETCMEQRLRSCSRCCCPLGLHNSDILVSTFSHLHISQQCLSTPPIFVNFMPFITFN